MTLLSLIIAAGTAWAALTLLLGRANRLPSDLPNHRSLHDRAVPRGGGLAIWAGWFAGTAWLAGPKSWLLPLAAVIAISLWDDRRGVPAAIRLIVHVAAASAWVWLDSPPMNPLLAVIVIVWMANLYNFMDGSDGLAAAMALFGFGAYGIAAWLAGAAAATVLLALAAAVVPFLAFNRPPARVFLGDVGAVPLGFIAAVFGIAGWQAEWWPTWFPVLVFLPFIADATITLLRRLARAEPIWEAHREHYYQRLVQLGWGHRGTLAAYGVLMAMTAASAVAALVWSPGAGAMLCTGWLVAFAAIFGAIDYHWRKRDRALDESKG